MLSLEAACVVSGAIKPISMVNAIVARIHFSFFT
jgi:hypothetical protein